MQRGVSAKGPAVQRREVDFVAAAVASGGQWVLVALAVRPPWAGSHLTGGQARHPPLALDRRRLALAAGRWWGAALVGRARALTLDP
jgi:hypothetical protein